MPSSPQVVSTQVVFDYLLDSSGVALPNVTVTAYLNGDFATSISPATVIGTRVQQTTTDANGYWQLGLIPNTNLSPANTTYTIQTPARAYSITVGAAGPYQSTAAGTLVNTPATLAPATSSVGALTVSGLLTAQAGLSVTGGATLDTLAVSTGGISMPGPLTLTAAAARVIGGATSLALRNSGNTNDNLLLTDAGVATIRAGLTVTTGGLTVAGGGIAVTGNSTITGTLGSLTGLTVASGGATVTAGGLTVTGSPDVTIGSAASRIMPGATSLSLRNHANSADNLLLSDAGIGTMRNALTLPPVAGGTVATTGYSSMAVKIEEQVLGGIAATIRIPASGSLPTGFRAIRLRVYARGDTVATLANLFMQYNGVATGTGWYQSAFFSNATATIADQGAAGTANPVAGDIPAASAVAGSWSNIEIVIDGYNNANRQIARCHSTMRHTDGAGGGNIRMTTVQTSAQAALTFLTLLLSAGNFAANTVVVTEGLP